MATILLSSSSFIPGSTIPADFKNSSSCGEPNKSPQFAWQYLGGLVPGHIEYLNLYVDDQDTLGGTSPNFRFMHWGVTHIPPAQMSITENGGWMGINPVILPTDYFFGDRTNGWNGPCAPVTPHTYRCWIEAKINPLYAAYIWEGEEIPQDLLLHSPFITFTDNITNKNPEIHTGDCGTSICPPGFTLVNDICQSIVTAPTYINERIFDVVAVKGQNSWGIAGTRFYEDVDQQVLPVRGTTGAGEGGSLNPGDAVLQGSDGVGVILPFTLDASSPLWISSGHGADGRLNLLGVWSTNVAAVNRWMGFSRCITVQSTQKYCIGVGARTRMRIKLNGHVIARFDRSEMLAHYQYWHIIEITLTQGLNIIEVEGYFELTVEPVLGFEIYKATAVELMALDTVVDLNNSGYVIETSLSSVGGYFDIGDDSGHTCAVGFAYNSCTHQDCIAIDYDLPISVDCCWRIQNCMDDTETYLIQFDSQEPIAIYLNGVYSLAGSSLFVDKCFKITDQEVCDAPDVQYVTIEQYHGENNCAGCHNTLVFQSCLNPEGLLYIELAGSEQVTPVANNIYLLSIGEGCYKYLYPIDDMPAFTDVTIIVDYQASDCNVCGGCLEFEDCGEGKHTILVKLAAGQDNPGVSDIDTLYHLGNLGDSVLELVCWRYKGYTDCIEPIYIDVTIEDHFDCTFCSVCYPYYLLTNCADPTDTVYIYWNPNETPLEEGPVYVFDFAPTVCYQVTLQFTPCVDTEPVLYDSSNIVYDFDSCESCQALCYKIIDCDTGDIVGTTQDLSGYVGKIIYWQDDEGDFHCSTVESYVCWQDEFTMIEIVVITCFDTCELCAPVIITEEFSITHRPVTPGYDVPECSTGSSSFCNNPCSPLDPCTRCPNT